MTRSVRKMRRACVRAHWVTRRGFFRCWSWLRWRPWRRWLAVITPRTRRGR